MADDINAYSNLPYEVEVLPEPCTDGGLCYMATHPELPGCMSHGATVDEALANLEQVRRLYIETLLKRNLPVPRPKAALSSSSGKPQRVIWTVLVPSQPQQAVTSNDRPFTKMQFEELGRHVA